METFAVINLVNYDVKMQLPRFKGEINLGQLLTVLVFAIGFMDIPRPSEFRLVKSDVERHDKSLKELQQISSLLKQNLDVLSAKFTDHLDYDYRKPKQN